MKQLVVSNLTSSFELNSIIINRTLKELVVSKNLLFLVSVFDSIVHLTFIKKLLILRNY
jgi:hypothetical protein